MKPIVIIGSGLAGYTFAREFRKLDQVTPVVMLTESSGYFYSKPNLSNALAKDQSADSLIASSKEKMHEQINIDIIDQVTATEIDADKKTVTYGDTTLAYDRLVLATGSNVIHPKLKGDAIDHIYSVNHLEDYRKFREALHGKKRIAIIGSGLIAVEFANDLIENDHELDIISMEDWPLQRLLPEEPARLLQKALAEKGIRWHFNELVDSVNSNDGEYVLKTVSGKTFNADLVFSAVGIKPEASLARAAGINVNQGIVVDEFLSASVKDVYALGDCAEVEGSVLQYVLPLMTCARALAKTLSGDAEKVVYPCMPVVVKTPAWPVVVVPLRKETKGEWQFESNEHGSRSLFYDKNKQLKAFILTGDHVKERVTWIKQVVIA
jgi:rubredoxin---NAD+ reductase